MMSLAIWSKGGLGAERASSAMASIVSESSPSVATTDEVDLLNRYAEVPSTKWR
jgi:hypothetical protein